MKNTTVQQQLDAVVAEYNDACRELRDYMLEPGHLNEDSDECKYARMRIAGAMRNAFLVKGLHKEISDYED